MGQITVGTELRSYLAYLPGTRFLFGRFARSVLTLVTGTTISQVLPVLIAPFLTRMYAPDAFGMFSVYAAWCLIIGAGATGRYELAIMLPEKDEEAINLAVLSGLIALIVSAACFACIILSGPVLHKLFGMGPAPVWLYLVPMTAAIASLRTAATYWLNRRREFRAIAANRVGQSGTSACAQLGFAFLPWGGGGLIAGNILGNAASTFSLCRRIWKEEKGKKYPVCRASLLKAAGRYRKFPQFSVAGGLLNTISLQMPAILLAWLYSPVVLGYYAIVDRILCLPTTLISTAIADVFRQRASDEYRRNKGCRRLLLRSTLSLLLFGLPPFCLIAAFGPAAFALVFGEAWRDAGVYARLLAVMFLFRFAFAPMSGTVIQITERLEIDTIWQSVLLVLSFLSIFVGYYYFHSVYASLTLYAAVYAAMYLAGFVPALVLSGRPAGR